MNSERNNERLKQIREKYGRPAKRNPDEDLRQLSHKRQVPPLQAQAHNNSPFSSYDAPLKPTRKDCKFDAQAFSRREKQNRPASPLSFINSPLARNFRQPQPPSPQLYDNALNYSEEFPRSQRPSLSENLHPCLSPRQSRPNVQDSSPIKKLQFQLEGQGTPRQLGNGIERYAAVTPHSAHSNRPLHPTDRSPACKPSPQQWQAEAIRRVPERAHMAPPRSEKAPQREECGEASSEEQAGKAFRLSSINNIQERIQWALAANKK